MTRRSVVLGCLLLAGCRGPEPVGAQRASLGEPQDGFPSWAERVVFVWTNRARADPAADLASCTQCAERACYTPQPPFVWEHALARSARFHSDNLALAGCSLQHDSPCTLVSDLGTRYTPGSCNGAPSCACVGGTATCGSMGTSFGERIGLFGGGARAENIATGSDPVSTFYLWLHERDTSTACGWRISNGHRANILGDAAALGVGEATSGGVWTQDFGGGGSPDGIVGGAHYPERGSSVELRANWYRPGVTPSTAIVNVGGSCLTMTVERGTGDNGTYLATASGLGGCVRYAFQLTTPSGDVLYPSTGSFGIGCADDWTSAPPPACGCTPSCAGRSCGDDGCGSSCGSCGADQTCNAAGSCVCNAGRSDCSGTCIDTTSDANNCGSCGTRCAASERCASSRCVASCTPSCAGRMCGDDGCGGSCGSCGSGEACDATGSCVACTPSCAGRTCGDDGCGGSCGSCGSGEACDATGSCVACTSSCAGRMCGDDGCGGSCGSCGAGESCVGGVCTIANPSDGGVGEERVLRGACGCRAVGAESPLTLPVLVLLSLTPLLRRRPRSKRR